MITDPADERLITRRDSPLHIARHRTIVRVKAWSDRKLLRGVAAIGDQKVELEQVAGSVLWHANLDTKRLLDGNYTLSVNFTDEDGKSGEDVIRMVINPSEQYKTAVRTSRDNENAIGAWLEHGILGTQLGPNKNGRKW